MRLNRRTFIAGTTASAGALCAPAIAQGIAFLLTFSDALGLSLFRRRPRTLRSRA